MIQNTTSNPATRDALAARCAADMRRSYVTEARDAALRAHSDILTLLRAACVELRAERLEQVSSGFLRCAPEHHAQLDVWLHAPAPIPAGAAVPWRPAQPGALAEAMGLAYYHRVIPVEPTARPDWAARILEVWLLGADRATCFAPWLFALDDADEHALIACNGASDLHSLATDGTLALVFAPEAPAAQLATILRTLSVQDGAA